MPGNGWPSDGEAHEKQTGYRGYRVVEAGKVL